MLDQFGCLVIVVRPSPADKLHELQFLNRFQLVDMSGSVWVSKGWAVVQNRYTWGLTQLIFARRTHIVQPDIDIQQTKHAGSLQYQLDVGCLSEEQCQSMAVDNFFFSVEVLTFTTYQARQKQNCICLAFVSILVAKCLELGWGGLGACSPRKNFWKFDALRWLLRPFLVLAWQQNSLHDHMYGDWCSSALAVSGRPVELGEEAAHKTQSIFCYSGSATPIKNVCMVTAPTICLFSGLPSSLLRSDREVRVGTNLCWRYACFLPTSEVLATSSQSKHWSGDCQVCQTCIS